MEQILKSIQKNHKAILRKNISKFKDLFSQIQCGKNDPVELMFLITQEFQRIECDLNGFAEVYLRKINHYQSSKLFDENLQNIALLETLLEEHPDLKIQSKALAKHGIDNEGLLYSSLETSQ